MKYRYNKGLLLVCLLFVGNTMGVFAQTTESFTIPLSNPNNEGKLVTHIIDGSITVEGYDGKDVIVVALGNQKSGGWNNKKHKDWKHKKDKKDKSWNKEKNEKDSDGMRKIADNSLEFTIEEVNNTVYIKYTPGKWVIDFTVKVPRRFSVDLKTINQGAILVKGVDGAHEVSNTNGSITMNNISGSVIADALNKDIIIGFDRIDSGSNMMFTSLNGDVDITFPNSLKANVMARSDNGDVYTDFEMVSTTNKRNVKKTNSNGVYKVKREKGISGSINGGGPDMTFKTLNGDILIRSN
jgi:hypothetical protein